MKDRTNVTAVFDLLQKLDEVGCPVGTPNDQLDETVLKYGLQADEVGDMSSAFTSLLDDKLGRMSDDQRKDYDHRLSEWKLKFGKEPALHHKVSMADMILLENTISSGAMVPAIGQVGSLAGLGIKLAKSPGAMKLIKFLTTAVGTGIAGWAGAKMADSDKNVGNIGQGLIETETGIIDVEKAKEMKKIVDSLLPAVLPLNILGSKVRDLIGEAELMYAELVHEKAISSRSFGTGDPNSGVITEEEIGGLFKKAWKGVKKGAKSIAKPSRLMKLGTKFVPGSNYLKTGLKLTRALKGKRRKFKLPVQDKYLTRDFGTPIQDKYLTRDFGTQVNFDKFGEMNSPFLNDLRQQYPSFNMMAGQMSQGSGDPQKDTITNAVLSLSHENTPTTVLGYDKKGHLTTVETNQDTILQSQLTKGTDKSTLPAKKKTMITIHDHPYLLAYTSSPFSLSLRPQTVAQAKIK